jgi:hypothetical protein
MRFAPLMVLILVEKRRIMGYYLKNRGEQHVTAGNVDNPEDT